MRDHTDIIRRLRGLIERLALIPACEECLAEKLGEAGPLEVQLALNELAGERDFEREHSVCGLCGETKTVIRKFK